MDAAPAKVSKSVTRAALFYSRKIPPMCSHESWTRPEVEDWRDAVAEGMLWLWLYSVRWHYGKQEFF